MTPLSEPMLDLSRLCREPVFTSRCAQESRQRLAGELVDHDLRWRCGTVDTTFFRAAIGRCELLVLRYGAEVEVRAQPFEDFVLIQMPLRGSASLECDGLQQRVEPGDVAVLTPREQARLVWGPGCEQLILKLPFALMAASQARLVEAGGLPANFRLPAVHGLDRAYAGRWFRLIGDLLEQLPGAETPRPHPQWLRHLEESLPLFLLSHHHSAIAAFEPKPQPQGCARQLHKVDAYMRSHLNQGVTLAELAVAVGLSIRSLNSLCQREYGQSPMERLRTLRLEAARERLLHAPQVSVTQVALEFGFAHMGRFAGYYRERFGELPRARGR